MLGGVSGVIGEDDYIRYSSRVHAYQRERERQSDDHVRRLTSDVGWQSLANLSGKIH